MFVSKGFAKGFEKDIGLRASAFYSHKNGPKQPKANRHSTALVQNGDEK